MTNLKYLEYPATVRNEKFSISPVYNPLESIFCYTAQPLGSGDEETDGCVRHEHDDADDHDNDENCANIASVTPSSTVQSQFHELLQEHIQTNPILHRILDSNL